MAFVQQLYCSVQQALLDLGTTTRISMSEDLEELCEKPTVPLALRTVIRLRVLLKIDQTLKRAHDLLELILPILQF